MRIAYFSPLNPMKSGISDYSEELLPYLAKYLEIDLYIDDYTPINNRIIEMFDVFNINEYSKVAKERNYDVSLYHIGNNEQCHEKIYFYALENPGIVVMHDFAIHHMVAAMTFARGNHEQYVSEMTFCHGENGKKTAQEFILGKKQAPWEKNSLQYPLNKRIIDSAKGLITHSYFTRNKIKRVNKEIPIKKIYHHTAEIDANSQLASKKAREYLGIPQDELMLASFGFANPAKRIDKIINAISRLHSEGYKFNYYIVGEVQGIDMSSLLKASSIPTDMVTITGHLPLDKFTLYMKAADICLNLRYPVQGETSGSLHRLFGMSKPILVSNVGSFKEYPNDTLIKINVNTNEEDEIFNNLKELIINENKRKELSSSAYQFAKDNLTIEQSARQYFEFIKKVCMNYYKHEGLIEQIALKLNELDINIDDPIVNDLAKTLAELEILK